MLQFMLTGAPARPAAEPTYDWQAWERGDVGEDDQDIEGGHDG